MSTNTAPTGASPSRKARPASSKASLIKKMSLSSGDGCKKISVEMADVPKSLYGRYIEVSEATFQALVKNHSADKVHHSKPILNSSSPHKGFEGCLPCPLCNVWVCTANAMRARNYSIIFKEEWKDYDEYTERRSGNEGQCIERYHPSRGE